MEKGTTFSLVVPFEEAKVQEYVQQATTLDEAAMARLNKMRVLLVEDNELNRQVAKDTLKELIPTAKVDIAIHGQDALNILLKEKYDVILMDVQMPVMDGVTATKMIRSNFPEPTRSVKIIAMTANVLREDVQDYFAAGMDSFVSKPFQADELLLKMDAVMGNNIEVLNVSVESLETKPVLEESAPPPVTVIPDKVTDMAFLKQLTGGNAQKMQKYVHMFLENGVKLLATMDQALAVKDYQAIKIAAHSLKPQLSYMGVKEDISHIFLIEQAAGSSAHFDSLFERIVTLRKVCEKAFTELRG